MKHARSMRVAGMLMLAALVAAPAEAGDAAAAGSSGAGLIRIAGSPADRGLLEALGDAYRARNPGARFSYWLHGPESTMAGVYTGIADLAVMAREVREPLERMAFEWVLLARPCEIEFSQGGLDPEAPGAQLGLFVNAANPLRSISLAELDAILGTERRRGGPVVSDWSSLEAGGAGRGGIRVHGPPLDSVAALFLRRRVMLDSRKWNPGYVEHQGRQAVLEAVAADPSAIGIVALGQAPEGVRLVGLSDAPGSAAVLPTRTTVQDRSYPLARTLTMVVHRPPGQPLAPALESYLRFVLGPEGQALIDQDGRHLPLSGPQARRQLARLD